MKIQRVFWLLVVATSIVACKLYEPQPTERAAGTLDTASKSSLPLTGNVYLHVSTLHGQHPAGDAFVREGDSLVAILTAAGVEVADSWYPLTESECMGMTAHAAHIVTVANADTRMANFAWNDTLPGANCAVFKFAHRHYERSNY